MSAGWFQKSTVTFRDISDLLRILGELPSNIPSKEHQMGGTSPDKLGFKGRMSSSRPSKTSHWSLMRKMPGLKAPPSKATTSPKRRAA